MSEKSSPLKS